MPFPINGKCNFDCTFCDRQWAEGDVDDASILRDAPLSELSGLRAMLGGGEPTLHPRLPELLEGLRGEGVLQIAMRTNAAWASRPELVAQLREAGLREVSVLFPTDDAAAFDRLTRRKGAFDAVMLGLRNLEAAEIRITLRIPLIRPTLETIPGLLTRIPDVVPGARRIDLVMLDIADRDLQVAIDEVHRVLPHRSDHPDPRVPPILLDPGPGIALCWTEKMAGWRIVPDCPTAEAHHPEPCERCFARHSCPGVNRGYATTFGENVVTPYSLPVSSGSVEKKRTSLVVMRDGAAFEPVKGMTYECGADGEQTLASVRLRVGHACNRRCEFCFIPYHEKAVHDYDIPASIDAAAASGARELVMTGGEPTLVPELPSYVRRARELGVRRIILQTNALKLADEAFTRELFDAGLTHVTVSLHSHRDDVLEPLTGKGKSIGRIIQGMENTRRLGLKTSITHVIGPRNYMHLPEFVKQMGEYVSGFCFIFATPMAWPMATKDIVVRFSDAAPYLREALDWCIENGIVFDGPSLKCGVPHCVLDGEAKYFGDAEQIPENNRTEDWIRVPACGSCVLNEQCYGVRRLYAWLYGIDEFKPVLEPGKVARDWKPSMRALSSGVRDDDARPQSRVLISAVAHQLGLAGTELERVLSPDEEHVLDVAGRRAFRVRYFGTEQRSAGALEVARTADLGAARDAALVRHVRAAAFGSPLGGAHGVIEASEADASDAARAFVSALEERSSCGVDYLTPHVGTPWTDVVTRVDALAGTGIRVLRRPRDPDPLAMSSVISAVAAAMAALGQHGAVGERIVRYTVWGYGRAGQSFAERFDAARHRDAGRPMMIGCADSRATWIDQRGLSHERITGFKARNGKIPTGRGTVLGPGDVRFEPADILVLSGRGSPLDAADASRVRASVVVDMTGALSLAAERILCDGGAVVVPAVIATAGPMLVAELEQRGESSTSVVRAEIDERTAHVIERAAHESRARGMTMTEAFVAIGLSALRVGRAEAVHERAQEAPPTA